MQGDKRRPPRPSDPGTSVRPVRRGETARRAAATVVAGLLGIALFSACSQASTPSPESPSSTGTEEQSGDFAHAVQALGTEAAARELLAQTESAILDRTEALSELATTCAKCRAALNKEASSARERIDLLGGTWVQDTEAIGIELPFSADAPYTVEGLVGYMVVSARDQLDSIAAASGLTAGQRMTMAGLLSGRLSSAYLMAKEFDIRVSRAVRALPENSTPRADLANLASEGSIAQSGDASEPNDTAATEAQLALIELGCMADRLVAEAPAGRDNRDQARSALDDAFVLEERISTLVAAGLPDTRVARCSTLQMESAPALSGAGSAESVNGQMVLLDIAFFAAETEEVRLIAAGFLADDTVRLVRAEPESAWDVSPLISGLTDEDQDD